MHVMRAYGSKPLAGAAMKRRGAESRNCVARCRTPTWGAGWWTAATVSLAPLALGSL
jgi:hypothetical protein